MFDLLGKLVSRYWVLVILFWVVLAVGTGMVAPQWEDVTQDGDLKYLPASMTSVLGNALLRDAFPESKAKGQVALVVERSRGRLTLEDLAVADRLAKRFAPQNAPELPILEVWTRRTEVVGSKLLSPPNPNGQAVLVILLMDNEFMDTDNIRVLESINRELSAVESAEDFPEGLYLGLSGSVAIGGDMLGSAKESIDNTETWTILLVFLILLLVYRAPVLVIIPLATIAVSVSVSMNLVSLLGQYAGQHDWLNFKIFSTTKIFIIVILFGAGTDYCLFLISRYKEELRRGLGRAAAASCALAQVSDALVASALTTILGLGMMYFADFGKFSYAGPTIAMCLTVALAASMTLAPALLRATGRIVFWPFGVGAGSASPAKPTGRFSRFGLAAVGEGFWERMSRLILARPGLILIVSMAILMVPAWNGYQTSDKTSYNLLNELQASRSSVLGTQMLKRHFAAGDVGPVTLVVRHDQGGFDTKEGQRNIAYLTKQLYDIDGIQSVRSYSEPLGDRPGYFNPLRRRGQRKIAAIRHPRTKETYLSQVPGYEGEVTRLDMVFAYDPFSQDSVALLDHVDDLLRDKAKDVSSAWHGAEFQLAGTTATIRDLKEVTRSDQWLIQQLVVLAVLAVLLVILRRPVICCFLILSVLLSYYVTIGATQLVFSWVYGATYEGLDWKVPIFLFVILVAIGEDYNIYLVTRVFEEQKRHGTMEGLRLAIVRTGGIITSCGIIVAGTFLSMMSGTLRGMLELGFALSLGVMLDTFIVRTVLVPAFLAWWQSVSPRVTAKAEPALRPPAVSPKVPSAAKPQAEPAGR